MYYPVANTLFQVDKHNCFSFTKSGSPGAIVHMHVITSPLNCKQPGVHLTSELGMKTASKHTVRKLNFTFHD